MEMSAITDRNTRACFTTDEHCPDCKFFKDTCELRTVGKSMLEFAGRLAVAENRNAALSAENTALRESNERLKLDVLIANSYSQAGLREELRMNAELRTELQEGRWGVLWSDFRAIHYVNEVISYDAGNVILQTGGERSLSQISKTRQIGGFAIAHKESDRLPPIGDICCRWGGDEVIIIIRGVTPGQLKKIIERNRQAFSPEQAIKETSEKELAVVASFAGVHASEIDPAIIATIGDEKSEIGWKAFTTVAREAGIRHAPCKKEQYDEMWRLIQEPISRGAFWRRSISRPTSERDLAAMFFELRCPGFGDIANISTANSPDTVTT